MSGLFQSQLLVNPEHMLQCAMVQLFAAHGKIQGVDKGSGPPPPHPPMADDENHKYYGFL